MTSPIIDVFEAARREFLASATQHHDIPKYATIKEVYDVTDKIQKERSKSQTLRNLRKIEPYLNCLRHYSKVVDTFVQVKPDILAAIWATETYVKGYEKIWDAMGQVGACLPQFERYIEIFKEDDLMKQLLCVFYKDILDFHSALLEFFHLNKRRKFLEVLWPKYLSKIEIIIDNIVKHRSLMDSQVNLSSIEQAEADRVKSHIAFERIQENQSLAEFEQVKSVLSANTYDFEIERFRRNAAQTSGIWLEKTQPYIDWDDPNCLDGRLLWLQGIPGAGKTTLVSGIVARKQAQKVAVAFALLSYRNRYHDPPLQVLHTLVIQLAADHKILRPLLSNMYRQETRMICSSVHFVAELLGQMLDILSTTYILVDGLDEIIEAERNLLLEIMLKLHADHSNLKILFSSRPEVDIEKVLDSQVCTICVGDGNDEDIKAYVKHRTDGWLSNLAISGEDSTELTGLMTNIGKTAKGMFLYARLVCDNLEQQSDVDAIKAELNNLPAGLTEAYGQIIARIESNSNPQHRSEARQILEWVCCCFEPLTKSEIKFSLILAKGKDASQGIQGLCLDILQRCGPIIEEVDDHVQFVHFSAREFLLDAQSGPYLREFKAQVNISLTCIKVLTSSVFDQDADDKCIQQNILSGAFLLENYICRRWFDHVVKGLKANQNELTVEIHALFDSHDNYDCHAVHDFRSAVSPSSPFSGLPQSLAAKLFTLDRLWKSRRRNLCFSKINDWGDLDPLILSKQQAHIRHVLDELLCSGTDHQPQCNCTKISSLYGPHTYVCSRPGCARFRRGFKNREERDEHIKSHSRPYKCEFVDCPYFDLGFSNMSQLQTHIDKLHGSSSGMQSTSQHTEFIPLVESKAMLKDAIELDDYSLMREMHAQVKAHSVYLIKICLLRGSSVDMLLLILEICKNRRIEFRWSWSLDWPQENHHPKAELFRILLQRGLLNVGTFDDIAPMASVDMFELWAEYGAIAKSYRALFRKLIPVKPDAMAEINVVKCLMAMDSAIDQQGLETCLKILGGRSFSLVIATYCLENGATATLDSLEGSSKWWQRMSWKDSKSVKVEAYIDLLQKYSKL